MTGEIKWRFEARHPNQTEDGRLSMGERLMKADFTYDGGGRLSVTIDPGFGVPARSLGFNSIGTDDPIAFLMSLDWGYVRDKMFGQGGRSIDFAATIAGLQKFAEAYEEEDLTRSQVATLRKTIREGMAYFDGSNDELACQSMISGLQYAGFTDDTHHMFRTSQSAEADLAQVDLWEPFVVALDDYLRLNEKTPLTPDDVEDDDFLAEDKTEEDFVQSVQRLIDELKSNHPEYKIQVKSEIIRPEISIRVKSDDLGPFYFAVNAEGIKDEWPGVRNFIETVMDLHYDAKCTVNLGEFDMSTPDFDDENEPSDEGFSL